MTQKFMKLLLLVSFVIPVQVSAKAQCGRPAPKQHKRSTLVADAALADHDVDPEKTRKSFTSVEVSGTLDVNGQTMVKSLIVEDSATVGNDLNVDGRLFADNINGLVTVKGSLTVNGPETINGAVVVNGTEVITGNVTIGSATTPATVMINGCLSSSPSGGVALCQYANFYGNTSQTVETATPVVPMALTSVNAAGAPLVNTAGTITGFVGGTYLITYMVTGAIGDTGTPGTAFDFTLYRTGTPYPPSNFGLTPVDPATTNGSSSEVQVSGQCIIALAATDYIQLQGTSFGTGEYLLPGSIVNSSITIEKIG